MHTSVLCTKLILYCSAHTFSILEPDATSNWQATPANTYHHRFLIRHFVRTPSTSQNRWWLQLYHTPNDSLATKNASFYVKSIIKVILHATIPCLHRCLVNCAQVHVHKATNLGLYYTRNNHYTTYNASFLQVETNYNF